MTLRHVVALLALLYWLSVDTGCGMDPLGVCSAEIAPVANPDSGCHLDPLGGCSPDNRTPSTDEGCAWDPLGGCRG